MKVEADKCEVDDGMFLPPNDFSIEWVPSGYKVGGRRGAKRRRLEANVAPPIQKPRSEFTCESLDDGDKQVAASVIELISSSPGTFEFERISDEKYARLLPFPAGMADDRIARGDWRLDPNEGKLNADDFKLQEKLGSSMFSFFGTLVFSFIREFEGIP
ncbi:hypothetical protein ANCCAN_28950 [Ancylostoma caninum]|uniref:Uncharacterized protein n=1 Tax=Ancylostoma caninum TaxID=29170 RepID=A0A368F2U8_ANCCA|nr:hypothetical protein ANCCAN_28950 [Ancylostoma caninum]